MHFKAYWLLAILGWVVSAAPAAETRSATAMKRFAKIKRSPGWTFNVDANPAMEYSLEELTGLVQPEDWAKKAVFMNPMRVEAPPAKFDWREEADGLTPIKNQKSCGSCWAFGTVAVLESILKIRDKVTRDISEQHLVSCNRDGWSCGGGWFAHDYHKSPGAVTTEQFPYVARDVACKSGLAYQDKIMGWGFVGGDNRAPTVAEIKAAVMEYGPVAVTVSANSAMQAYTGGIFNSCTGRTINHLVNIVGWNDDGGYWIMRNSWGSSWGEKGYMRIKYGCNLIGQTTSFVRYKPACNPQPMAYTGEDREITAGDSTYLGGMPVPGQTYTWSPSAGLDNSTFSRPLANPVATTTYTLKVSNECGTAEKKVTVTVH